MTVTVSTVSVEHDLCFSEEEYDKVVTCAKMWGKSAEEVITFCLTMVCGRDIMGTVEQLERQLEVREERSEL